jgi:hypothetical protein
MRIRALVAVITTAVVLVLPTATGTAVAQRTIGPNQHFVGLVNGSKANAEVRVVCGGPAYSGRTGPVAGGQSMSVARVATGGGYTGPFHVVSAWFVPASAGSTPPTQLRFTAYGVPQSIPTSIQVPCGGNGQVEFSSCPYLAPCASGWVPEYVTVNFVDIAA